MHVPIPPNFTTDSRHHQTLETTVFHESSTASALVRQNVHLLPFPPICHIFDSALLPGLGSRPTSNAPAHLPAKHLRVVMASIFLTISTTSDFCYNGPTREESSNGWLSILIKGRFHSRQHYIISPPRYASLCMCGTSKISFHIYSTERHDLSFFHVMSNFQRANVNRFVSPHEPTIQRQKRTSRIDATAVKMEYGVKVCTSSAGVSKIKNNQHT